MDFTVDQLRAAVYTSRLQQLQVASVAGVLLGRLQRFTGNPLILPVPADAPLEIPRIVLTDSAGAARLQIAMSRSDLFLARQGSRGLDVGGFLEEATEILEVVLGTVGVRPGRLAATGSFFHRCDDPATILATHFCDARWVSEGSPFSGLQTFELHTHRRFELLEGLEVNSWVRCKSGSGSDAGSAFQAIVVERDVNTTPEEAETRQFDPDELSSFMREAGTQLASEIPRFFPE